MWVGEKGQGIRHFRLSCGIWAKVKSRNNVGIIVDKYWKNEVINVKRLGDRFIAVVFVVEKGEL